MNEPPSTNVYARPYYHDIDINADNDDDNGNTNLIIQTKMQI